jgi:hypothetical protein
MTRLTGMRSRRRLGRSRRVSARGSSAGRLTTTNSAAKGSSRVARRWPMPRDSRNNASPSRSNADDGLILQEDAHQRLGPTPHERGHFQQPERVSRRRGTVMSRSYARRASEAAMVSTTSLIAMSSSTPGGARSISPCITRRSWLASIALSRRRRSKSPSIAAAYSSRARLNAATASSSRTWRLAGRLAGPSARRTRAHRAHR